MATRNDVLALLKTAPSWTRKPDIPWFMSKSEYTLLEQMFHAGYATGQEEERSDD